MTRRHLLNLAAVAPAAGLLSGFQPEPLRALWWTRHEAWLKTRRSLQTLFLRGVRSDGAVFTVAASVSEGADRPARESAFDRLTSVLDKFLDRPMGHGETFATGTESGYRV